jgi:hypothetical protein
MSRESDAPWHHDPALFPDRIHERGGEAITRAVAPGIERLVQADPDRRAAGNRDRRSLGRLSWNLGRLRCLLRLRAGRLRGGLLLRRTGLDRIGLLGHNDGGRISWLRWLTSHRHLLLRLLRRGPGSAARENDYGGQKCNLFHNGAV